MTNEPLLVGAVAYTPNVVPIWEGMRDYFRNSGAEMDFVLFSNYGRQVEALLNGAIDIAWNTNLAWVRTVLRTDGACRALAMRDTDLTFSTVFVTRPGSGIRDLAELKGRRVALGSRDSAQAAILPVHFLRAAGLGESDVDLLRIDSDLGKHGDTGNSELDVLAALRDGRAHAGTVGDLVWVAEQAAGRIDPTQLDVLWTTPPFDHCMFDAMPSLSPARREGFARGLFAMRWEVPAHRRLLELEGLKQWLPPREEGYQSLRRALDEQEYWEPR
jgi:phosphonate transport system substrate-binding protein